MSYQLYRRVDAAPGSLLLGSYVAFEDALVARDEDTVRLFAATSPGEVMLVRHDIIGPGEDGPATLHPVTTAVERRSPADLKEVDDVRGWLARIHAMTS
jgi:transketolase